MKKSIAIIALFSLISLNIQAQRTATWKGGTPGRTTDWNCPSNWKEGRVPDEFTHVIIPDVSTSTFSDPAISEDTVVIASLEVASNARLRLRKNARVVELDRKPVRSKEGLAETNSNRDSGISTPHGSN
jgi:hypothetical protein